MGWLPGKSLQIRAEVNLQAVIDDGKMETLQEMYHTWPFFSVTMDMIEMVFAKVSSGFSMDTTCNGIQDNIVVWQETPVHIKA